MRKNNSPFPVFCFFPTKPQARFPPSRKEAILDFQVEKFRLQLGVVQKKTKQLWNPEASIIFRLRLELLRVVAVPDSLICVVGSV